MYILWDFIIYFPRSLFTCAIRSHPQKRFSVVLDEPPCCQIWTLEHSSLLCCTYLMLLPLPPLWNSPLPGTLPPGSPSVSLAAFYLFPAWAGLLALHSLLVRKCYSRLCTRVSSTLGPLLGNLHADNSHIHTVLAQTYVSNCLRAPLLGCPLEQKTPSAPINPSWVFPHPLSPTSNFSEGYRIYRYPG